MNIYPILKDIYFISTSISFFMLLVIYLIQPKYVDNGDLGFKIAYWIIFPFTPIINTVLIIYMVIGMITFNGRIFKKKT